MKVSLVSLICLTPLVIAQTCTLTASGADDAPSLLTAARQCSTVTIPKGTTLNIATALNMTGLQNTHISLQGTLKFNPNVAYWAGHAFYFPFQNSTTFWLFGGQNIRLDGGGVIDGSGQAWYDAFPSNASLVRPIISTIYQANGAVIENITMNNSPNWFNLVYESKNVRYNQITIISKSSNSNPAKNTDGFDTFRSDGVIIQNSVINNGDDCVSFKPNTTNTLVSNLSCTGSHGISVGSLGQYAGQYDIVQNVTAINITMINASNGARIKAWAGPNVGSGLVKNITFSNFQINNTENPAIVDQCYSTASDVCAAYPSNTYLQDIYFNGVTGTAHTTTLANLKCSPNGRCNNVHVDNLKLSPSSGAGQYVCQNVKLLGNSASLFPSTCRA